MAMVAALASLAPAIARADEPRAILRGVEDEDLRERIEAAIGRADKPSESRFQARRRAADAAEEAVIVLRSEGYYGYDVVPEVTETEPPKPVLRITPGPRYLLADPKIEWVRAPEPELFSLADAAMDLWPGEPGRAAEVVAAEGRVVAALTEQGYADAKTAERRVVVDHADLTVRPQLRFDAGVLVKLDGVLVDTEGRTNPRWVAALAPWTPGQSYDPEAVAELERRLLDTGVYDSITVALAPADKTTAEGLRPVIVSLADRPKATLELGVGYSTSEGFGLDTLYNRYNRFGRADTLTGILRLAEIQKRVGYQLALPHWRRPAQTLTLGVDLIEDNTEAYKRTGGGVRADLKQRFGKTSFWNVGVSLDYGRNEFLEYNPFTGVERPVDVNLAVFTASAGIQLDRSNDPLNPTRGWRLTADVQPTLVAGQEQIAFLRAVAQGTYYRPLDKDAKTVAAARLRVGTILNGRLPETPSDRRFYAGGGGSVRGYEYQGIGPRLPTSGRPVGGLSVVETSIEARRRLFGRWGAAVFVDGGSVSLNPTPDFSNVRFAGGFGVRYELPFAPIRADIAFPFDNSNGQPAFQVYISIGQAF